MTSSPALHGTAFTEGSIQADGFTIRYFRAGRGEPVVVLHSAAGFRFSPALDRLTDQHDVILLVLPGWGEEPDNGRNQSLAELADTVHLATQALGLDSYHLLGSALSSDVALTIALDHPERVSSLVLEAPGTFRERVDPSPLELSPEEALRAVRVHPERQPVFEPPTPDFQARLVALVERLMGASPDYPKEVAARLPDNPVRTLVVFGADDGYISPENGRTLARLKPHCSFVLLHDAAHDVQGDRAEDFAALVMDFLADGSEVRLPQDATLVEP